MPMGSPDPVRFVMSGFFPQQLVPADAGVILDLPSLMWIYVGGLGAETKGVASNCLLTRRHQAVYVKEFTNSDHRNTAYGNCK